MPRGRRADGDRMGQGRGKYYMISVVAKNYGIHPQTLRLYEREGLLKPSRTEGNTRLYSEDDVRQLEVILNLTRDLGVNLAGVEIVLVPAQHWSARVPPRASWRSCQQIMSSPRQRSSSRC